MKLVLLGSAILGAALLIFAATVVATNRALDGVTISSYAAHVLERFASETLALEYNCD